MLHPYKYDIGNYTSTNIYLISDPIKFMWNQMPIGNVAVEIEKLIVFEDAYVNEGHLITNYRYFEPVFNEIWARKPMRFYQRKDQDEIINCISSVIINFLDIEAEYVNSFSSSISITLSDDMTYTLNELWMTTKGNTVVEKLSEFPFSIRTLIDDQIKITWNGIGGNIPDVLMIASIIFNEDCNDGNQTKLTYSARPISKLPPTGLQILYRSIDGETPTPTPGEETTATPILTTTPISIILDTTTITDTKTSPDIDTASDMASASDIDTTDMTSISDMITTIPDTTTAIPDITTISGVPTGKKTTDEFGFNIDDDLHDQPLRVDGSSAEIFNTPTILILFSTLFAFIRI